MAPPIDPANLLHRLEESRVPRAQSEIQLLLFLALEGKQARCLNALKGVELRLRAEVKTRIRLRGASHKLCTEMGDSPHPLQKQIEGICIEREATPMEMETNLRVLYGEIEMVCVEEKLRLGLQAATEKVMPKRHQCKHSLMFERTEWLLRQAALILAVGCFIGLF